MDNQHLRMDNHPSHDQKSCKLQVNFGILPSKVKVYT